MRIPRSMIGMKAGSYQRRSMRFRSSNTSGSVLGRLNGRYNTGLNRKNQLKSTNQVKTTYMAIKKSAEGVQEHLENLRESGEKSLFGAAKESGGTGKIVEEIKDFVTDYNNMMDKMNASGSSVNKIYRNQMEVFAKAHKSELKNIGITMQSDGTMEVDREKLDKADYDKLEKIFGGDSNLSENIRSTAGSIAVTAESYLQDIKNGTYNNYNLGLGSRYGGYGYNNYGNYNNYGSYGNYGSGYNYWG